MEENTELVCVMASLGYADGDEYFRGVDCIGKGNTTMIFLSVHPNCTTYKCYYLH